MLLQQLRVRLHHLLEAVDLRLRAVDLRVLHRELPLARVSLAVVVVHDDIQQALGVLMVLIELVEVLRIHLLRGNVQLWEASELLRPLS